MAASAGLYRPTLRAYLCTLPLALAVHALAGAQQCRALLAGGPPSAGGLVEAVQALAEGCARLPFAAALGVRQAPPAAACGVLYAWLAGVVGVVLPVLLLCKLEQQERLQYELRFRSKGGPALPGGGAAAAAAKVTVAPAERGWVLLCVEACLTSAVLFQALDVGWTLGGRNEGISKNVVGS